MSARRMIELRLARRLQAHGVEPLVMCQQKLDERCKKVAADKRDSRVNAGRVDRYLAGSQEALVKVRIPSDVEEDWSMRTQG